ncbi:MarR family transcriptional regulator [Frigoribacterium sp. ACAM 257]|uniref:MarR family winged helix-turn-helix transcriptional regulator n=1 Tax=Frigoribacterium sp. ACAM 257 TaxID=2508998 RepID=UPI0011B9943E|nr:MarR family transcriptional regulator [Frigoribacterium sp. ACAM 257]TWX38841.1 MarR family transcriptional regulator [Frigoribacterium sp. ACAM 257]
MTDQTSVPRATTDALDLVHDQWSRLRPDLDVSPVLVVGRITRLARIIQRRSDDLLGDHGIGRTDFDLLAALVRTDVPTSPGRLAEQTLLSPPAVTKRLRGLTAAGLVERSENRADARGYFVSPTARGRELLHGVLDAQLDLEGAMTASLDPAAVAAVTAGLRSMLLDLED